MNIDLKTNKSKTYFLPLFAKYVNIKYFPILMNTYFWYDNDISKETFHLLYKFDGKIKGKLYNRKGFIIYEDYLTQHELFIGYMDYQEYVIYQFKLLPELIKKRDILLKGQYSKLSPKDKNDIIDFTLIFYDTTGATILRKILNKDKGLRLKLAEELGYTKKTIKDFPEDAELSSAINIQEEIFENSLK